MSAETGSAHRIPVPRLARRGGHAFEIAPAADARAALAARLGLLDLRKLSLRGEIAPDGPRGWRLDAALGATVVQRCGVTLAPVTTRIDETVTRRYAPDVAAPGDLLAVSLVAIAAMTLPHVVVVAWLDRQQGVWRPGAGR